MATGAMSRLSSRDRRRDFLWGGAAVLFAVLVFALIQAFIYPLMDGWSHYPLGDDSLMPYRDYFYPVPPLTYWEAGWVETLHLSLLGARLVFLFVPVLAALAIYSLSRLFASPAFSFTLATFGVAALASIRLEALQGWNIQSLTYIALGAALLARGWTQAATVHVRTWCGLSLRTWLLCMGSGVAFSAAALTKQTSIVSAVLVLLAATAAPILIRPAPLSAGRLRLLGATLLAPVVIAGSTFCNLAMNGALGPFVLSMLSGGGKQPSAAKLIEPIARTLEIYLPVAVGIAFLTWVVVRLLGRAHSQRTSPAGRLALGFASLVVLAGLPISVTTTRPEWSLLAAASWIAAVGLVVWIVDSRGHDRWGLLGTLFVALGVAAPIAIGAALGEGPADWITIVGRLLRWGIGIFLMGASLVAVLGICWPRLRRCFWKQFPTDPATRAAVAGGRQKFALLVGAACVAASFVNSLSSTGVPTVDWYLPGAATALAFGWTVIRGSSATRPLGAPLTGWLWVAIASVLFTVVQQPYSWFGWTEPPVTSLPRTAADLNYVQGVLLAPKVEQFYQRVAAAEVAAARASGATDPTVFGFPNIPAVESITPLQPYPALRCPIPWVDLCPDHVIAESLRDFELQPANVVVWADPDDDVLLAHERGFTGHRSALRDWIDFRDQMVSEGVWTEVDRIPVTKDSPNRWPVHIYAVSHGESQTG
jgi:hypothetical protein